MTQSEWLESGPPRFGGRDVRVLIGAVVLAVVVTAVSVGVYQRSSATAPVPQPSATTAPATSPATSPARSDDPSGSPFPITVTRLGHPLLGVTDGWELIGYGPTGLVRIQPARGTIITQELPSVLSNGSIAVTAGRDFVVIRPWDDVGGFLVVDGRPVAPLTGLLATAQIAMSGPDPAHVWAVTGPRAWPTDQRMRIRLVDRAGRVTGPELPVPRGSYSYGVEDGTGHLVLTGTGGAYLSRPDGLTRITSGELVAIGPTRFLSVECDDRASCRTVVTDRRDGSRRDVGPANGDLAAAGGLISPDGRWASVPTQRADGTTRIVLVDLATGNQRELELDVSGFGGQPHAWSPDSRWLLVTDQTELSAVDVRSGGVQRLGEVTQQLHGIIVRSAPAS